MLETERLILRRWRDSDLEPFAALNSDPAVMEHFPSVLSRQKSDEAVRRFRRHFDEHGFGLFALEVRDRVPFAGFVGLSIPDHALPFSPCVEVGWRLALAAQGHGYATEAAREALRFGFERADLDEIVSFAVPANGPSRRVMEKLGMSRDPAEDFDHPNVPDGSPLQRHVLYRLSRDAWRADGCGQRA